MAKREEQRMKNLINDEILDMVTGGDGAMTFHQDDEEEEGGATGGW